MTAAEREALAARMVPRACELACLVRDRDAGGVDVFLAAFDPAEADALVVVLAAMVPVDGASPGDLLAWAGVEGPGEWFQEPLLYPECRCADLEPCGTYAAYVRHKRRGEGVDPACEQARRDYKNGRYRARGGRAGRDAA